MKIAVIGSGAIGGLVAGYLKLKGEEVTLVGRADSVKVISANGLEILRSDKKTNIKIEVVERLNNLVDLVILATKTQDVDIAIRDNLEYIKNALILTTENGVRADEIVARYLPKENIISSIVMFGATYLEPGKVVHNFDGNWVIGRIFASNDPQVAEVSNILAKAFTTIVSDDIQGMKYLKIFINANNCIPALLGISMQEAFSDLAVSGISMTIWKEGLEVISKAGISLVSLPDFPIDRVTKLASLSVEQSAKIFSDIMMGLSKEPLYGSVLQSIKRDRRSEIDYINGEFVRLAELNNTDAPLNKRLTEMVHHVEETKKFFTKEELLANTKEVLK